MPGNNAQRGRTGELYEEHLVLGAEFGSGLNGAVVPDCYPLGPAEAMAFDSGAALTDVSGLYTLLFHGAPAEAFSRTCFAGKPLQVGECSFEAVLTGDGAIASIPLLARTGTSEYAVWDFTSRSQTLDTWLTFLAEVSQGGVTPFAGLEHEWISEQIVPLVLWGRDAREVLSDYVSEGTGSSLPLPGRVASIALDGHITTLVTCLKLGEYEFYLLMVPSNMARNLWRSLLSFEVVHPVGLLALRNRLGIALPWLNRLETTERIILPATELESLGLIRKSRDFVGARGLC